MRRLTAYLSALVVSSIGVGSMAPSAMAACGRVDGTSTNGGTLKTGSNPVRYKYANSPYVGVQYDSCGDVVRIFFGGYGVGTTHYNLRYSGEAGVDVRQIESPPGRAKVLTLSAARFYSDNGYSRVDATVQACSRGTGVFSSSACTRWSPTVGLLVRPATP